MFNSDWDLQPICESRKRISDIIRKLDTKTDCKPPNQKLDPVSPQRLLFSTCSKCPDYKYITADEFREHSKSVWHIHNTRNPSEPQSFIDWSSNLEQVSVDSMSSSGWISEYDSITPMSKLILNGIPYTISHNEKLAIPSVIPSLDSLLNASYIAVLLLRSGRFAGAVWSGDGAVLAHTCFKRYTVRRKNGGSQSKNDRSKGATANSVGAQIRRAQEKKLSEEVLELISHK